MKFSGTETFKNLSDASAAMFMKARTLPINVLPVLIPSAFKFAG